MTVYELLLSIPQSYLSKLYTILDKGEIYYEKRLVFTEGQFVKVPFPSVLKEYSVQALNHIPLINLDECEQKQTEWSKRVKELYQHLTACMPLHSRYVNFVPTDLVKSQLPIFSYDYSFYRIALELYILFHGVQKDLEWDNKFHFFTPITEGCVVFKRWLI